VTGPVAVGGLVLA